MARAPGVSVRLKLTIAFAGVVMLAGVLLLAAVWLFLLRYVPDRLSIAPDGTEELGIFPVRSNLLRFFAPRAAVVLAVLLVVGIAGGWLLAGRLLAPLTRITDVARTTASGSLGRRIALPGRRDEFRELADAFDAMLARLEAHVTEQQRFAANASHELRTPLAITQTLLDVARQERGEDPLVEQLHTVNTRAIELTEALLLLGRADRRSFVVEPVDLSLVAEEAAETLLPLAEARGVTIATTGDQAAAGGSPALLLQLTTNLVHNAIVHNRTGSGRVWVTTATGPAGVSLTVENTGEQLDAGTVATLHEPFRRGAGRVRADDGGVGLGLAIAQRITEAHDGRLSLAPRPGGGLRATVDLPSAA